VLSRTVTAVICVRRHRTLCLALVPSAISLPGWAAVPWLARFCGLEFCAERAPPSQPAARRSARPARCGRGACGPTPERVRRYADCITRTSPALRLYKRQSIRAQPAQGALAPRTTTDRTHGRRHKQTCTGIDMRCQWSWDRCKWSLLPWRRCRCRKRHEETRTTCSAERKRRRKT